MAKTRSMQASGTIAPWLGVALIVILCDQLTKIAVMKVLEYLTPYPLTPFFNLLLVFNQGAAFSFLAAAFTVLGLAAAFVIAYLLKRHSNQRLFCTALSLIMGGALGNVIDRLVHTHLGGFLGFHGGGRRWPRF